MPFGYQHHMLPAQCRYRDQIGRVVRHFGGNRKINTAVQQHLHQLLRAALHQRQTHRRVALAKLADHRRQGVARLGMGGSNT